MKKFLAIYIGTMEAFEKTGWNKLDPKKRKELEQSGMQAWMAWGTAHAAATVDQGNPLGKTKRASKRGIEDIKNKAADTDKKVAETERLEIQTAREAQELALGPLERGLRVGAMGDGGKPNGAQPKRT